MTPTHANPHELERAASRIARQVRTMRQAETLRQLQESRNEWRYAARLYRAAMLASSAYAIVVTVGLLVWG